MGVVCVSHFLSLTLTFLPPKFPTYINFQD